MVSDLLHVVQRFTPHLTVAQILNKALDVSVLCRPAFGLLGAMSSVWKSATASNLALRRPAQTRRGSEVSRGRIFRTRKHLRQAPGRMSGSARKCQGSTAGHRVKPVPAWF